MVPSLLQLQASLVIRFAMNRIALLLFVQNDLTSCCLFTDKEAKEIEVKNATSSTLEYIVNYLEHHNGKVPAEIQKPLRSFEMKKVVEDPWDAEFVDGIKKWKALFDIVLAANYMDVQPLLHLGCAKIASCIKGKTQEEIKEIFKREDIPVREAPAVAADKKDEKKA